MKGGYKATPLIAVYLECVSCTVGLSKVYKLGI